MKIKTRKPDEVLAESLRHLSRLMCDNPDRYSLEDGRALDRALRSCKGISDIDRVWVRWSYFAEKHSWLTVKELVTTKSGWRYKEQ